jgi:hypothetical protein
MGSHRYRYAWRKELLGASLCRRGD